MRQMMFVAKANNFVAAANKKAATFAAKNFVAKHRYRRNSPGF